MGFRRAVRKLLRRPAATFDATSSFLINQAIYESANSQNRVSRDDALSVPAMLRGRNLICSIATLPLVQLNARNDQVRNPLFEQLDPDVPNVVTLAQTLEDLVFESISWWKVTAQDFAGFPVAVRHLDVKTVSLTPPPGSTRVLAPLPSGEDPRGTTVWINGAETPASMVIRFDSPNPPVLKVAGRAIRRAVLFDKLSSTYANNPRPLDYFSPADGADPISDDEIRDLLAEWQAQRKRDGTAYVPAALRYNSVDSPSPADMQLVELQKQAGLAIANALGIDPEELGISTTSRTYANVVDRRKDKINDVLAPYMLAVTQRLSMGDVTRRGNRIEFDLDDYLKSNPTERWATYKTAKELGAMTVDEIREEEGRPPLPPEARPAPPPPMDPAAAAAAVVDPAAGPGRRGAGSSAAGSPARTFDSAGMMHFDMPVQGFKVDVPRRTIEGVAVPYGPDQVATKYGMKYRFVRGALKWGSKNRVKMLRDHDMSQALGVATDLTDLATGLRVKFKLDRSPESTIALQKADDGVLDGLSVGVEFTADDMFMDDDGVANVTRADLREVSLTAMPAFDDARVTKVAASRNNNRGAAMEECATCGQRHAPGVACPTTPPAPPANNNSEPTEPNQPTGVQLTADQRRNLLNHNPALVDVMLTQMLTPRQPEPAQPQRVDLSADQITALLSNPNGQQLVGALLGVPAPATEPEPRPVVDPTRRTGALSVTEPESYRFDRRGILQPAAHDFGIDLIRAAKAQREDDVHYRRAMEFIRAQFVDIATTDVNELTPTINQPRYIDEREYRYPIYNAIARGAPPNGVQPFSWPKFSSAGTLVAAHTEGTEPTPGTYITTSQTVTPSPLSGKARIHREVWDMGGTPGLSGLLWNKITRSWYETVEAAIVTMLGTAAAGMTSLGTMTAGGGTTFQTLVAELTKYMTQLQFARGGFRFDVAFAQADLFGGLTGARDGNGRPLLPMLGVQNANGQPSGQFAQVDLGSVPFLPAWALAAAGQTVDVNSYLIDRTAVDAWVTPPERIDLINLAVAYVEIGVWGYQASAVNDLAGTRKIVYH